VDWNVALIIATSLLEIEPEQTLYDPISFRGFALHKGLAPTSNMRRGAGRLVHCSRNKTRMAGTKQGAATGKARSRSWRVGLKAVPSEREVRRKSVTGFRRSSRDGGEGGVPAGAGFGGRADRLLQRGHRVSEAVVRPLIYGADDEAGDLVRSARPPRRRLGDPASQEGQLGAGPSLVCPQDS